jgi:hypothetical protein
MLALAAMLAQQIVVGSPRACPVGGWGAPLGIDRAADGLRAIFLPILHRAWFRTRTAAWPQERIPLQKKPRCSV